MKISLFLFLLYIRPVVSPVLKGTAYFFGAIGLLLCLFLYIEGVVWLILGYWGFAALSFAAWWGYERLVLRVSPPGTYLRW